MCVGAGVHKLRTVSLSCGACVYVYVCFLNLFVYACAGAGVYKLRTVSLSCHACVCMCTCLCVRLCVCDNSVNRPPEGFFYV